MDRLQGHINHIPCGEPMSLECLEQGMADYRGCESYMVADNHHHHMPFLHMLLEEQDQQQATPSEPSSFQLLLRLQEERLHHQPTLQHPRSFPFPCSNEDYPPTENDTSWPRPLSLELESCVTHASESLSDAMNHHHHHQHEQQHHHREQQRKQPSARGCKRQPSPGTGAATKMSPATVATQATTTEPPSSAGEKRKRKRPRRPARNVQEVESQRMTHIAVERNRRKLMNDHLSCLRSLMPASFVQRGDQASIIGGAIDFVKELEQLLQSLQAEKRARDLRSPRDGAAGPSAAVAPFHGFFSSPQYTTYTSPGPSSTPSSSSSTSSFSPPAPCPLRAARAEEQAGVADVEATVVQTHVNLRVLTPRRPAQLLRAIAALEELHLSVLHLNITSHDDSLTVYTRSSQIEEECKLGSADEIAAAAHHIFSLINSIC
ncbi:hypothetical protein Taro_019674 [Colocasia esculenta]|uniref:BHLH domain-containing protein n=1 Tax=Colocasia esculenta TaxID=4460 RepID=A0A843UU60_COLES|nr:hypothetical protein [Colocasia esculenta]